ncbi:MAG TPA: type II toxin-antitoxin system HicB family antitoxin [Gaiellaceae bacterium]|nr:type II toxin-antitoxin system HicB family antitoxin [Gaiellaceae bacterium]
MTDYAELATRYLILIEGGPPSNFSAWSPDLPGCVATGETLAEVETEMRAAIRLHLEGLAADGGWIPDPSGPGVYVERSIRVAA